jgi:hypothetical protein
MKKTKSILIFLLLIGLFFNSSAQELLSYQKIQTLTKEQIKATYFIPAEYDVDVYKIIYVTKAVDMSPDTASGTFCSAVDTNSLFPVMIYDHGTVKDRHDVPSEGSSELSFVIGISSLGFNCVAPDYIGLGISKGIHPYIHPESEANAGIDLMYAVKNMEEAEKVHFNNQIFVTGYSQGGHAAMATVREMQNTYGLKVTAAVPMSGPYSISKEMRNFTLGDEEYYFCGYIGSLMLSAKLAYPDLLGGLEMEDIFKPAYAVIVRQFEKEKIDLSKMNEGMITLLSANGGKVLPKNMFKPEIINGIFNDENNPVYKALKRMDVCDWKPEMPLKMLYCKADDQVTYRNSVYADSLMKTLGAVNVSSQDVFSFGNHGQCILPAVQNMMDFFKLYQQIGSLTSSEDMEISGIDIYPNPANEYLRISGLKNNGASVLITDISGNEIIYKEINIDDSIDISNLSNGIYFVIISTSDKRITRKLVK